MPAPKTETAAKFKPLYIAKHRLVHHDAMDDAGAKTFDAGAEITVDLGEDTQRLLEAGAIAEIKTARAEADAKATAELNTKPQ